MFEPDGRNSIQTLGHWGGHVIRIGLWVVFAVCVVPVVFVLYMWQTMKLQQGAMEAIARDPKVSAVLVDFNQGSAQLSDLAAYEIWRVNPEGVDPSLQALPFQVTYLQDRHPGGPLAWTPTPRDGGNAWMAYNLPFEEGAATDRSFEKAFNSWIYNPVHRTVNPFTVESFPTAIQGARYLSPSAASSDPWFLQGLGKMAPTRYWDWHSGLQLAQAKASYNYHAYVAAARAVSRMRLLVAADCVGAAMLPSQDLNPIRVATNLPEAQRFAFLRSYTQSFQGQLPKMLLLTQDLGDGALLHDPRFTDWQARNGESGWQMQLHVWSVSEGPFIVGMTPWDGYHPYDRGALAMEFTYGDFFYRSSPAIRPQAKATQDLLLRMQAFDFWEPHLKAAGLSPRSLSLARELLADAARKTQQDTLLARRYGHKLYHHQED